MKYRIQHIHRSWGHKWTLQNYWPDEGGGGWNYICSSPFRWPLRAASYIHKFSYEREIKRIAYKEAWTI